MRLFRLHLALAVCVCLTLASPSGAQHGALGQIGQDLGRMRRDEADAKRKHIQDMQARARRTHLRLPYIVDLLWQQGETVRWCQPITGTFYRIPDGIGTIVVKGPTGKTSRLHEYCTPIPEDQVPLAPSNAIPESGTYQLSFGHRRPLEVALSFEGDTVSGEYVITENSLGKLIYHRYVLSGKRIACYFARQGICYSIEEKKQGRWSSLSYRMSFIFSAGPGHVANQGRGRLRSYLNPGITESEELTFLRKP